MKKRKKHVLSGYIYFFARVYEEEKKDEGEDRGGIK